MSNISRQQSEGEVLMVSQSEEFTGSYLFLGCTEITLNRFPEACIHRKTV